ncbi:hypothetical protein [Candidatus Venteria ishoeyi]|uniref:SPOR domain-containing protein n=1 Tax=Candidatus Venteria ishoeyi TaxID=1899563 RepID=A0A1H6F5A6_9GAMM|nr:hypothetical protein [Candidatus Venteria ishoeyi]SEH04459.1 Uncharacterised protein [Candidatus Venteria ishoeyi]
MKKLIFALVLFSFSSLSHAYTYTCYRYASGHPTGTWISVKASSKSEAESKAYIRMKELGGRVDYAKCK